MISRRNAMLLTVTGFIAAATPAAARSKGSTLVGQFDTDGDGTVDLAEAKKAAGDLFDRLDTDKEGTLSLKELRGRVSRRDLVGADPDHDNTLTKDEYLAVVERRFKAADRNNDGKLPSWELHSPAGRALVRLLR
jgi:Ca2+-binding EF-hand superfamily protein